MIKTSYLIVQLFILGNISVLQIVDSVDQL
jgi:hypothetical protein